MADELMIQGKVPSLLVAIVGTRKPSREAAEAAFAVGRLLAELGIGVVSGLALGIDAAAHRGCLAGGGSTVAVLGHGLEVPVYPPQHSALAEAIRRRGALASPFPVSMTITRRSLLARNRWIARLAHAVWVVQTGVPGGALAAAAHARQLSVPVITTPWNDSQWQIGYQSLLRHGAESVELHSIVSRLEQICCVGSAGEQQGKLVL